VTLEMYSVDMKMERQYTEINYSSSDEAWDTLLLICAVASVWVTDRARFFETRPSISLLSLSCRPVHKLMSRLHRYRVVWALTWCASPVKVQVLLAVS
jgi:hypothetical protein